MSARLTVPVGARDHRQGPETAPVTLVEYGDYECPYCGAAYPIVKAIQERLGPELRFVFRNFPLEDMHPHARQAAEAAEAAGVQGRFWEMHDALYENQRALDGAALIARAEALGLDVVRFAQALDRRELAARVDADLESGAYSGVNGTPTFFVNGRRHDGPFDLESLLEAVLAANVARQRALR